MDVPIYDGGGEPPVLPAPLQHALRRGVVGKDLFVPTPPVEAARIFAVGRCTWKGGEEER